MQRRLRSVSASAQTQCHVLTGQQSFLALLFWFFMVVHLSICLWYVSIVATCIAVHFAVCHALYNNKNKKIGKNRCLVFLNDLVLFCSVILSL